MFENNLIQEDEVELMYDKLIHIILEYHPSADVTNIRKAYQTAQKLHLNQKRKSGEPYIIHPLSVAIILAELRLDKETIMAGLLHDIVEDTDWNNDEIADVFGAEVAFLVEGVTNLDKLPYQFEKEEIKVENYRKMFVAMAQDIRVILIKLADRLHNMRTLAFQPRHKQIEIAQETIEIYVPLSHRLGIWIVKNELEDFCLQYLNRGMYDNINRNLIHLEQTNKNTIDHDLRNIKQELEKQNIVFNIDVYSKHIYSIYKKIIKKKLFSDTLYDFYYYKIIAANVRDCYLILGSLHRMYLSMPERFKDYIAMPKVNRYQAIHTTLLNKDEKPFEVQIQTREMDEISKLGITNNWKYKENANNVVTQAEEEKKLNWLKTILEWQKEITDNREFLSVIKGDFNVLNEHIYCFTPTGEVKYLNKGSCIVDFAYTIHSDIGNHMVGAMVNEQEVPMNYTLQNGDVVTILTSPDAQGPNIEWLDWVKTPHARSIISKKIKEKFFRKYLNKGKESLKSHCKKTGNKISDLDMGENLKQFLEKYNLADWNEVLVAIGFGTLSPDQVMNRLIKLEDGKEGNSVLQKIRDKKYKIKFSSCCKPVYGDSIVGVVSGDNVLVHRHRCSFIMDFHTEDKPALINLQWSRDLSAMSEYLFTTELHLIVVSHIGDLEDVTNVLSELGIQILSLDTKSDVDHAEIMELFLTVKIGSCKELKDLLSMLGALEHVLLAERVSQ